MQAFSKISMLSPLTFRIVMEFWRFMVFCPPQTGGGKENGSIDFVTKVSRAIAHSLEQPVSHPLPQARINICV